MIKSQGKLNNTRYSIYVGNFNLNDNNLEGNSLLLYRFPKLALIQWVPNTNDQLFMLKESKLYHTQLPTAANNNSLLTTDLLTNAITFIPTQNNNYFDLIYTTYNDLIKETKIYGLKLSANIINNKKSLFAKCNTEIEFLATYQNDLLYSDYKGNIFFVAMKCSYNEILSTNEQTFITQIKDIITMRSYNNIFLVISQHEDGKYYIYEIIPDERKAILRLIDDEIGGISDDLRWVITSKGVCDFMKISNDFLESANFTRAQALVLRYQLLKKREKRLKKYLESLGNDE
ncbi:hypothetical protein GPJ56_003838 [Histomonas meleagridis]|uniref:uncharacterized protein n=1 Tax=Histomonas meleagridis TaxID=135588 RepID=UPI00355A4059|nr:hypothetical protein GPJ56_003838 [Histomonas meleagridis]KAH0805296.1 hypothetical protein GO595_002241 [Histomonas meleagridis]